jgi:hypothetical protein
MKFKVVTSKRDWIEEAKDRDSAQVQANTKLEKGEMILFIFKQDWGKK